MLHNLILRIARKVHERDYNHSLLQFLADAETQDFQVVLNTSGGTRVTGRVRAGNTESVLIEHSGGTKEWFVLAHITSYRRAIPA